MINRNALISNASSSVANTIVSGIVLFLLYKYSLTILGPKQLGIWAVAMAWTAPIRLGEIGLAGAIVKVIAGTSDDERARDGLNIIYISIIIAALASTLLAFVSYVPITAALSHSMSNDELTAAKSILHLALLSSVTASLSAITLGALEGYQLVVTRNVLNSATAILSLTIVIVTIDKEGIKGVAYATLAANITVCAVGLYLLWRRQKTRTPIKRTTLLMYTKELLNYGVRFQGSTLAIQFFEPASKILMSKFGSLESTTYLEMANQLISKLRLIFISANQAIWPALAKLSNSNEVEFNKLADKTHYLVIQGSAPYYAMVMLTIPLCSILWIGHYGVEFIEYTCILLVGWYINTTTTPIYFTNLAKGRLHTNTVSHSLIAITNLLLGWILGNLFSQIGVVIASTLALIAGSAYLRNEPGSQRSKSQTEQTWSERLNIAVGASIMLAMVIFSALAEEDNYSTIRQVSILLSAVAIFYLIARKHPALTALNK